MNSFGSCKLSAGLLLLCANLVYAENLLLADHPLAGKIWDMQRHSYIQEARLQEQVNMAEVLLLGETHDNLAHHQIQHRLLKFRLETGSRPALLMEQFDAEIQPELDLALAGSNRDEVLGRVSALVKFSNAQAYQPLLSTAVDYRLPLIAANVPNKRLQPVIWNGYAAYDAGELKRLAVEEVWSESRQKFLASNMGGAHCGQLREELRAGLTRSQRLRDALMVDSAVSAIGRGVVAIVGSSHARRDIGLPLYFAARLPSIRIISIGMIEVSPGVTDPRVYEAGSGIGEAPYDFVWFTPRAERDDPCAGYATK